MANRKTIDDLKHRLDKIWIRVLFAFISAYAVMLTASFIQQWTHNLKICSPDESFGEKSYIRCFFRQALSVFTPDNIEGFSILTVAFLYVLESQERRKNRIYEAWQVFDNAAVSKVTTSYARIAALEYLKENSVALSGINVSGADLSLINLSGANLSGAVLSRADLSDSDLSGAKLYNSNLRGADLSNADLSDADLSDANLSFAKLSKADLRRAKLYDANLSSANLNYAKLDDAEINDKTELDDKWRRVWKIVNEGAMGQNLSYTDLSSADLGGSGFSSAILNGVDLSGTNLFNANLFNADLRDANLSDAKLFNAELSGANLRDANLSNADLSFANLFNVNLRDAKNLTVEQVKSARNWEKALYDDSLGGRLGLSSVPNEKYEE